MPASCVTLSAAKDRVVGRSLAPLGMTQVGHTAVHSDMTKKLYTNGEIEVSWEPDLCFHSAMCVRGAGMVFDPRRRPWIQLEHATSERILAVVDSCPSGALKARRLAADRLLAYAARCRPEQREEIRGLASGLLAAGDSFDTALLREFMLFTNDLDVTRGQSFRSTHGELLELITQTGFRWTDETLHAATLDRVG